jgi:pimeloyl-ACP methyl ester carboxylesterase
MSTIEGPLHAQAVGDDAAPPLVFVHPNPMDGSSWLYQVAHFSTWYRCITIDLPGYGRSPGAREGMTLPEIAGACWEALDRLGAAQDVVLVGCSVGSTVVQHMYHLRPDETRALVVSGAGWRPEKDFTHRMSSYREKGLDYRYEYTLDTLSPEFRESPLAHWFARLFSERNGSADLATILRMFEALEVDDPEWLQLDLAAPVLIVTGETDIAHQAAFALRDRLPRAELVVARGAGHACHLEQPWLFDAAMMRFLRAHGHSHLPAPPAPEAG